jgi:hypothetical protein
MNTTEWTDEQVIQQCNRWLSNHYKKPLMANRSHAQYIKDVIEYYAQHRTITRLQRNQLDAILWVTDKKIKHKFNKKK